MIKIKIHDPFVDRNEPTFRSLLFVKNILRDYSIDITESNDFDYMFIGMNDFINKDISLEDSIEWGLSNIDKISKILNKKLTYKESVSIFNAGFKTI